MDKTPHIPFVFGRIVSNPNFVNRTDELAKLKANVQSGINTILISPRRWGKSSLVHKAVTSMAGSQVKVCMLDLFNVRTEHDFYETYAREILKSTSPKWRDWIENAKHFLRSISPRISFGVDPLQDFSVSFDFDKGTKTRTEILELPERIAAERKIKIIVCIDEFQNLSYYDNPLAFQKLLRSVWQHHKQVTYCLYGSKRHMITEIFETKSMPFYKFGEVVFLKKIETKHWRSYIINSFRQNRKSIQEKNVAVLVETVKNHPYFVQQLARKVWMLTQQEADETTIANAVDELLHENSILYLREAENLSNTQMNFLNALCDGVEQLSSAETLKKYKLGTSANVVKIKSMLEQREIIDFMGSSPEFIDPMFELWLKRIYFHDH